MFSSRYYLCLLRAQPVVLPSACFLCPCPVPPVSLTLLCSCPSCVPVPPVFLSCSCLPPRPILQNEFLALTAASLTTTRSLLPNTPVLVTNPCLSLTMFRLNLHFPVCPADPCLSDNAMKPVSLPVGLCLLPGFHLWPKQGFILFQCSPFPSKHKFRTDPML